MTDAPDRTRNRVSSVQRAAETRVANPLLRRLLRSRLHGLVSGTLVLVSYVGRRSGRRYEFPVAYSDTAGGVVAVTPKGETNWWKNFRRPLECAVWHRGAERAATGSVVTGAARGPLLAAYLESHGFVRRMLGVGPADGGGRAAESLAVVRFEFEET